MNNIIAPETLQKATPQEFLRLRQYKNSYYLKVGTNKPIKIIQNLKLVAVLTDRQLAFVKQYVKLDL